MYPISSSGMMPMGGMQPMSPQERMEDKLTALVSSGEINSTDEEAISNALDDIDSALQSSAPEEGSPPPTREEMEATIDSLIDEQVEAGNLTEEQAEELSAMFDDLQEEGPQGPPPPPSNGGMEGMDMLGSQSSDNSADIGAFLQQLADQNATSYGTNGSVSGSGSYLFNYSA